MEKNWDPEAPVDAPEESGLGERASGAWQGYLNVQRNALELPLTAGMQADNSLRDLPEATSLYIEPTQPPFEIPTLPKESS